jgi:hypothetical protein
MTAIQSHVMVSSARGYHCVDHPEKIKNESNRKSHENEARTRISSRRRRAGKSPSLSSPRGSPWTTGRGSLIKRGKAA